MNETKCSSCGTCHYNLWCPKCGKINPNEKVDVARKQEGKLVEGVIKTNRK